MSARGEGEEEVVVVVVVEQVVVVVAAAAAVAAGVAPRGPASQLPSRCPNRRNCRRQLPGSFQPPSPQCTALLP